MKQFKYNKKQKATIDAHNKKVIQQIIVDEHNKRALKLNSPDLVVKPYLPIKPLNHTIWKKMYVTPNLEMKRLAILEQLLKSAFMKLLLIMLYPFIVMILLLSL